MQINRNLPIPTRIGVVEIHDMIICFYQHKSN